MTEKTEEIKSKFKILSTQDEMFHFLTLLIYGKNGTGKTMAIRSLPEESTLLITAEHQGLSRLSDKKYDYIKIENWQDLTDIYLALLHGKHFEKYKTIFVDSISHLNEFCKIQIVKKDRAETGQNIGKVYEDLMTINDYQLLQTRMQRMVIGFGKLPFHIIFTAREIDVKDDNSGRIHHHPELNGKFALNVGSYFSEVYRLIVEDMADKSFANSFVTKKMENTVSKGDPKLSLYETGENGTVDISLIIKKIFGGKNV